MKRSLLLVILCVLSLGIKSQLNYNELIKFSGSNFNVSKVIVDEKIYCLNVDSDSYVINKLNLNGDVISSQKYYTGRKPENGFTKGSNLYQLNNKLISVFFYSFDSTMIFVSDTLTGNLIYSKSYNLSYQGSELLDNGNLIIYGNGLITSIDANSGNIISSFSYPYVPSNSGIWISDISKNKGSSMILSGYAFFNYPRATNFILKVDNNQTMSHSGLHLLPIAYGALNTYCKEGDLYYSNSKTNGGYSNVTNFIFKTDTTFSSSLKNYEGISTSNTLQNSTTAGVQTMLVTDNNVLISITPNDLTNFSYYDLMHNQEIISFDRNLNYIKTIQYPSYSYTMEPTPKIDYYKGNTYMNISTSSYLSDVASNIINPSNFNYFWLNKGDSLGETSCVTQITHSTSNISISDSTIIQFFFTPVSPVVTNVSVTHSNSATTPTIMCNTITNINSLANNNSLDIYPNPTSSILNIYDKQNQLKNSTIEIKNYLGQVVYTTPFTNQIDLSNLPAGMYFLTVKNKTIKIIKQ